MALSQKVLEARQLSFGFKLGRHKPCAPDMQVRCTVCDGMIVIRENQDDGRVYSEYRDREGRCFACAEKARKTTEASHAKSPR